MSELSDMQQVIKGSFLILLAVSGNFVAETLSCQTQKLLTGNMLVKQIVVFFSIYFVLGLLNDLTHPIENIKKTTAIYILYVMLTKMDIHFTFLTFIILGSCLILINYISFYKNKKNKKDKDKKYIKILINMQNNILKLLIAVIILGFSIYFFRQRKDHKKNWSIIKYLFGIKNCGKK